MLTLEETKERVESKVYPRVTEASIKDKIAYRTFLRHEHLTVCILTMENGFFVVGKAAPADRRNYDAEVGERYAFEDAFKQLWQLEGYALRNRLEENSIARPRRRARQGAVPIQQEDAGAHAPADHERSVQRLLQGG